MVSPELPGTHKLRFLRMLVLLEIENFRCFEKHTIPFKPYTIIVGKNNAGKSTVVEALRLISIVVSRHRTLVFKSAPLWTEFGKRTRGISPSTKNLGINVQTIFHRYGEPPAKITATFESKQKITVYIGPDGGIFSLIQDAAGRYMTNREQVLALNLPEVGTLPQVSALAKEESVLRTDYVRSSMSSHLSSWHFRNQLKIFKDLFPDFKQLAESTWPHLRIHELSTDGEFSEEGVLSLLVQDADFVAEIGWMGHGLQVWLQMVWYLTRTKNFQSIILDEPDVYLHADIQRKLARLLRGRNRQVIIATHSIEIISEVDAGEILVIDKVKSCSSFTTSLPAVQQVIDNIGGVQNIQLTRLWSSKRCLLVEGKDVKFLNKLHSKLYPESDEPLSMIPNMSIGGWGGWNYAVGSSMFLSNAGGDVIVTYCILDSDYYPQEVIDQRMEEAQRHGIDLHIWSKKEIENHLLHPETIKRLICKRIQGGDKEPSNQEICGKLQVFTDELRIETFDKIAGEYLNRNRGHGVARANDVARDKINAAWATEEGSLSIVSGKKLIAKMSTWAQNTYQTSISPESLASEMRADEIHIEMKDVLSKIENSLPFV